MVCSCTHFFRGKATGIIYSGYVSVALGIQHAMRHIKLTSVAFLPVPNLPTLSHKRQVFFFVWKIMLLNMKCVLIFLSLLSEPFSNIL